MAPSKLDEIRELLAPEDGGAMELSAERLEQLYLEVAPQVRRISSISSHNHFSDDAKLKPTSSLSLSHSQILDGPAIEQQLSKLNFLPTGCDGIDDLLEGGLRQGQVTELTARRVRARRSFA